MEGQVTRLSTEEGANVQTYIGMKGSAVYWRLVGVQFQCGNKLNVWLLLLANVTSSYY